MYTRWWNDFYNDRKLEKYKVLQLLEKINSKPYNFKNRQALPNIFTTDYPLKSN